MTDRGRLIVVSGPSGSGKSTVIRTITEGRDDVWFSVSMTTRPRSQAETDGVDYWFVTQERFDEVMEAGGFLECDRHMGNSYGTPRAPVEEKLREGFTVILDIDVKGAEQVLAAMPEALLVFIAPPDMRELERRLRARGRDSEEQLIRRLQRAEFELSKTDIYHHIIVNDILEKACEKFAEILKN